MIVQKRLKTLYPILKLHLTFEEQKNEHVSSQSRLQKRNSLEKKAETEQVWFLSFIVLHNGLSFVGLQYPCFQTLI